MLIGGRRKNPSCPSFFDWANVRYSPCNALVLLLARVGNIAVRDAMCEALDADIDPSDLSEGDIEAIETMLRIQCERGNLEKPLTQLCQL